MPKNRRIIKRHPDLPPCSFPVPLNPQLWFGQIINNLDDFSSWFFCFCSSYKPHKKHNKSNWYSNLNNYFIHFLSLSFLGTYNIHHDEYFSRLTNSAFIEAQGQCHRHHGACCIVWPDTLYGPLFLQSVFRKAVPEGEDCFLQNHFSPDCSLSEQCNRLAWPFREFGEKRRNIKQGESYSGDLSSRYDKTGGASYIVEKARWKVK